MSAAIKNVLVAVCGGIAAYKSAELVRLLRKAGLEVRVVMTESARQFVAPLTFQALSGHPVHSDLFSAEEENAMGHINLARWADVMVVAPASANMIAKYAQGLCDDLASTLLLVANCPIVMAPAMNQSMWRHPATQHNVKLLTERGTMLIGPEPGEQACGETGYGRMSVPTDICRAVLSVNKPEGRLQDLTVVISAGPTREKIDPVRFISNRSSGKMGYALAKAAHLAGANVTLISGPVSLPPPDGVICMAVESAAQMHNAVLSQMATADIYIGAAAVADYTPETVAPDKLKKNAEPANLVLVRTRDILSDVAALAKPPFTVGFAAETQDLVNYAHQKLVTKNIDMIAANWVGRDLGGFDSELNALEVFWRDGQSSLPLSAKSQIAERLIELIAMRFYEKNRIQDS